MRIQIMHETPMKQLGVWLAAVASWVALPGLLLAAGTQAEVGFRHFYNLEYDQAIAAFRQEIAQRPQDPAGYNHLAQAVLYRGLYRSGQMENSLVTGDDFLTALIQQPKLVLTVSEDAEFKQAVKAAFEAERGLLERNPNDAAGLYALGATYGLRANYRFLVEKAWLGTLRDSNAARRFHNQVAEMEPGNTDAKMLEGLHSYVVASLPAGLRMLGAVVGIRGDKERGLQILEDVATHGSQNSIDARIVLATLYRHEKRSGPAMQVLDKLVAEFSRNYLFRLARVYTLAEMRDRKAAMGALREVAELARTGAPGYDGVRLAKLQYAQGWIYLRTGDLDQAMESLGQVAETADPEDATMRLRASVRLGQVYDLRGQRQQAREAYQRVVASAPKSRCGQESQRFLLKPYQGSDGG
jgi:tetratricopeptide (TPR) repeat protein